MPRKSTYGEIKIATNDGRLRLRLPAKIFEDGNIQHLTLGLDDTPENRLIAELKIVAIKQDIIKGQFDPSLNKYRKQSKTAISKLTQINDIWLAYLKYKQRSVKETHYYYMSQGLGKLIADNPYQSLDDALTFREWLLEETTNGMTKRVLTYCNAAVEWAIRHRLCKVTRSPYAGMAGDLPKHDWEIEGKPNAFTLAEIDKIRSTFATHEDIRIENYAMFVDFLFLTGCRPSEAIGLRVSDISPDRSFVHFNGGLVTIGGKLVRTKGSKNNRARKFPVNRDLEKLLDEAIWDTHAADDLIFTSISRREIRYSYFCAKIWKPIVNPIVGRESTPYSCRDSFISHQLDTNIAPSKLAAWCDTSIVVIQKRYLDPAIALETRPSELIRKKR